MVRQLKENIKKNILKNNYNLSNEAIERLKKASAQTKDEVLNTYFTSLSGLDDDAVKSRRKQFGTNQIQREKAPSWLKQLLTAFINPFIGILLVIAIVSFIIDIWLATPDERDYKTIIVVSVMVLISVILRFVQEFRSNQAAEKLKRLVTNTATVIRQETGRTEINFEEIVPGDIIHLSAGDMIPAD